MHLVGFCSERVIIQSNLDKSKLMGLFFTSSNYPKCKLICTSGNLDLLKSLRRQVMVGESNKKVFLIRTDASNFAVLEISEFEYRELTVFKWCHLCSVGLPEIDKSNMMGPTALACLLLVCFYLGFGK